MNSVEFYAAFCAPIVLLVCCYLMVLYHRASLASSERAERSKAREGVTR